MKNEEIKISVIIPIYNVEKYLSECIESLINQTLLDKEYEIILVNDGSNDNSLQIAENYYQKYNNIKLINQSNMGLSQARNSGLDIAIGEYIFFLDSDDLINSGNMLNECYDIACKDKLDILMFDAETFFDEEYTPDNNRTYDTYDREKIITPHEMLQGISFFGKYYFKQGYVPSACMYLVRREYLIENNFYFLKGLLHEDEEFTFKCLISANRVEYINKKFYKRRHRNNSITIEEVSLKHFTSYGDIVIKNLQRIKDTKNLMINKTIESIFKQYNLDLFKGLIFKFSMLKFEAEEILEKYIYEFIKIYYMVFGENLEANDLAMISWVRENLRIKKTIIFFEKTIINTYQLKNIKNFEEYINMLIIDCIKTQLEHISLMDCNKTVAIYGLGEHTKQIIKCCELYVGEVKSKLIFIDTYKKSLSEKFLEKDVINVKDIHNYDVDEVVISSASYEDEMMKNLKNTSYKNKIITFYSKMKGNLFRIGSLSG